MKRLLLLLVCLAPATASPAQGIVRDFSVRQVSAGLQLSFTVVAGNTCLGIGILRSDGSTPFTEIGFIGGVCGSTSEDVFYSYVDSHPLVNRQGYYKLDLEILGLSGVVAARFLDYGSDGVIAIPSVSSGLFNLYFANPTSLPVRARIHDLSGRTVRDVRFPSGSVLTIDLSNERRGLYIFDIQLGSTDVYRGKLIVH
jgi:hypothetical protein